MSARRGQAWLSFAVFTGYLLLCFAFLASPAHGAALLPLFSLLLVLVAWLHGPGASGLLVLVATLVVAGFFTEWPEGQRAYFAGGLLQLWAVWFFLHSFDKRFSQNALAHEDERAALEKRRGELTRENEFLTRYTEELGATAARRQQLAACAKDVGGALNGGDIQARLVEWTQKIFPGEKVILAGLFPDDPLDKWVADRRQAMLCEDLAADNRFRNTRVEEGTKSLMVAPVVAENKVLGALRVESATPRRFAKEDLRTLDVLSTLGSLSLDNAFLYQRVEEMAVRDGLTRLLTHKAFEERMGEELLRAGRYRHSVALLMVDVDHFKKVNDTHGHAAGDDVLRKVSALLSAAARPVDVAARYGGEEFSLLLVEMTKAAALEKADALRRALEAETFEAGGKKFRVTMSVGLAVFPDEATTAQQLVRTADQRLYQAKTGGRNRVAA